MAKVTTNGEAKATGSALGVPKHVVYKSIEIQLVDGQTKRIKGWLDSLSSEQVQDVAIIQDDAFVATIFDAYSSPLGPTRASSPTSLSNDTSLETVATAVRTIGDIEERYRSITKSMTPQLEKDSVQGANIDRKSLSLDVVAAPSDGKAAVAGKNKSEASLNDVRIEMEQEDVDVFRIQASTEPVAMGLSQLSLETVNVIFPPIVDFVLKQHSGSGANSSSSSFPILTFDGGKMTCDVHDLSDRVAQCFDEHEKFSLQSDTPFWIHWLLHCNSGDKTAAVSLATLIQARLEVALVEAFQSLDVSLPGGEESIKLDGSKEGSVVVVTGHGVDKLAIPGAPSQLKDNSSRRSNRNGKGGKSNSLDASSTALQDVAPFALKDIVAVSRQLSGYATKDDIAKVTAIFGKKSGNSTTIVPLSGVVEKLRQYSGDKGTVKCCLEWNGVFESVVSTLWNRSQAAGFSLEGASSLAAIGQHVADKRHVQDGKSGGGTKRKKKKKSKKKKKAPNADAAALAAEPEVDSKGKNDQAPSPKENSSPKSLKKSVSGATGLQSVPITEVKEAAPAGKSEAIQADSVETSSTHQTKAAEEASLRSLVSEGRSGSSSSVEDAKAAAAVPPPVGRKGSEKEKNADSKGDVDARKEDDDDDDAWETVESKSRSNRSRKNADSQQKGQKSGMGSSTSSNHHQQQHHHHSGGAGSRKAKGGGRPGAAPRKRTQHRKIVREIISSIIDKVEVEAQRRKAQEAATVVPVQKKAPPPTSRPSTGAKPTTLRDVVMRGQVSSSAVDPKTPTRIPSKGPGKHTSQKAAADQNTAPTVPETWSGTSANTDGDVVSDLPRAPVEENGVGDSSSDEVVEAETSRDKSTKTAKSKPSPAPPLPTLLGPGNTNSATSSVASSLEAPHAICHHHHHHHSPCDEDAVGYHLLDVCDRLSKDMNVFMARRALALTARRRERGALLASLQDTASNIWIGQCHVEMYGSCATQLDLPSSDLDLVIRGLDLNPVPNHPSMKLSKKQAKLQEQIEQNFIMSPYSQMQPHSVNGERVLRLAAELERQPWAVQVKAIPTASVPVVKILADPSRLPGAAGAMQNNGDWIMQHQHMSGQATAAASGVTPQQPTSAGEQFPCYPQNQGGVMGAQSMPQSPFTLPWRGADVMNGLFSVDVTFEGPEHGGIGSTAFSARAVQDACNETSLPPEQTSFVQVLMVLKELLAQRRLNEPFSGGLSSYAMLLLLVAVLKERKAIREEMERIERHRKGLAAAATVPAADSVNTTPVSSTRKRAAPTEGQQETKSEASAVLPTKSSEPSPVATRTKETIKGSESLRSTTAQSSKNPPKEKQPKAEQAKAVAPPKTPPRAPAQAKVTKKESIAKKQPVQKPAAVTGASWATIARKNSNLEAAAPPAPSSPSPAPAPEKKPQRPPVRKISSFAEAVSGKQSPKPKATTANNEAAKEKTSAASPNKKTELPKLESSKSSPSAPLHSEHSSRPQEKLSVASESSHPSEAPKKREAFSSQLSTSSLLAESSLASLSMFPQGSNDVLEVLCSGETSAGKLLMHFLLFYGQHFDALVSSIDVSGMSHPDFARHQGNPQKYFSPFVPRRSGGSIDPVTGMLTVDPIVIRDPWEGAHEGSNVAKSCYAWNSIRWHFAQCYMTLSSAVERSGTQPTTSATAATTATVTDASPTTTPLQESTSSTTTQVSRPTNNKATEGRPAAIENGTTPPIDSVSPLLELLLSF